MRVFELYLKRIFKRKLTFILILLLPVVFTYSVVAQYEEATKVTLTMYIEDATVNSYVSDMLKKQNVTITQASSADDAIHHRTNLGIVFTPTIADITANPDTLNVSSYVNEPSVNSNSLQVKLNSVFSVLKTLAKNTTSEQSLTTSMQEAAAASAPIQVEQKILGNPNAVVLTSSFNMIVFIIMFLTMTNTLLFLGDKVHTTTQRLLLAAGSKLSYYLQTVSVFAVIGVGQFILMVALMTGVFQIDLSLSVGELLLLVLAYGLLNMIAAGLGLLLISRTSKMSTGRLLITVVSLPLAMLGGTLWPSSIMPEGMQKLAQILPTQWITELNNDMFSGFTGNSSMIAVHIISLFACAAIIFLLLTRVRTEDI
ncbi:ABC transporter permease [Paenibacillus sp. ACRSA]|uniref:ABC transporter permease n=1 Tax=Paenibacillus sp. ACRSA TaxID=2918211 RepID=UPI001EF49336|nr:ABC transporter permease [Paenibacillus sp. ACRSA]